MRISDWSSDVCSSDLFSAANRLPASRTVQAARAMRFNMMSFLMLGKLSAGQWSGLASIVRLDQLDENPGSRPERSVVVRVEIEQIGRAPWRDRVCQYV